MSCLHAQFSFSSEQVSRHTANAVLTRLTIDLFGSTKAYLRELGCRGVTPMLMQPPTLVDLEELRPTPYQIERFLDDNYNAMVRACGYEGLYKHGKLGWVGKKVACGAGISECAVGPDGELYPCRVLLGDSFASGSLLSGGFMDFWRESPVLQDVRSIRYASIDQCGRCDLLGLCLGGCRGTAYQLTGSLEGWIGRELCHEQQQILMHKLVVAVRAERERSRRDRPEVRGE
ncbi:SPASM domain-containing protein [Candidatus Fermentibacteria bacterium]|nr:SPASM domain-containing protein [Candidatus Fermentibacteria bacterium]